MAAEALRGADRPDPGLPFGWGAASGRRLRVERAYFKEPALRGGALPRWGGNLRRGGCPEAAAARTDGWGSRTRTLKPCREQKGSQCGSAGCKRAQAAQTTTHCLLKKKKKVYIMQNDNIFAKESFFLTSSSGH